MTLSLLILLGGFAFVSGFGLGVAASKLALREREKRLRRKIRAVEAARVSMRGKGYDFPAWIVSVLDEERSERRCIINCPYKK